MKTTLTLNSKIAWLEVLFVLWSLVLIAFTVYMFTIGITGLSFHEPYRHSGLGQLMYLSIAGIGGLCEILSFILFVNLVEKLEENSHE